jgi:protease inhibitor Inh
MDRTGRLIAGALANLTLAVPAMAQPAPPDVTDRAGGWDLSVADTFRKCRVTLALDAVGIGRAVRFPAGCRRAVPLLNAAAGWVVPQRGTVRLLDRDGKTLLDFSGDPDLLTAKAASGEAYRLERQEKIVVAPPAPPPIVTIGVPQVTPVDPATAPPFASLPGTYLVDRYTEQEVCRIDLGLAALAASGRYEARLLEGCRDAGLSAFDPVAWSYGAGRLTLVARRGHEVQLISERDGRWRRDPEVGATLVLRKAR